MTGIYLTPVSRLIEIALGVSGLAILLFAARAFLSSHAWGDGAEYDMLDLPRPKAKEKQRPTAPPGTIGVEDRIVRFGFSFALGYLAGTWFGIGSLAMWILCLPVVYFILTALTGKDPIYRKLGLTTQMP